MYIALLHITPCVTIKKLDKVRQKFKSPAKTNGKWIKLKRLVRALHQTKMESN